ncbi:hypothetical protein ACO0SA_004645 [Hanseniaspora valbyensis]
MATNTDCCSSKEFPDHLKYLLAESKFLHLATCNPHTNVPSISMMHYLYVPQGSTFISDDPNVIVLLTSKETTKFKNISENKNVSVLLHDWMLAGKETENDNDNFTNLLKQLNQQELKRNISASVTGEAFVLKEAEEINFYQKLLQEQDPDSMTFKSDSYAIVKIKIISIKTNDEKNNLKVFK